MTTHFDPQVTVSLTICPRCLKPHVMPLIFRVMEHPFIDTSEVVWNYASTCTNNLQPILAHIVTSPRGERFVVEGSE